MRQTSGPEAEGDEVDFSGILGGPGGSRLPLLS